MITDKEIRDIIKHLDEHDIGHPPEGFKFPTCLRKLIEDIELEARSKADN